MVSYCRQVQYRMHPIIREFPSAYFYGGRLQDGAPAGSKSVERHRDVRFGPLVVSHATLAMCSVVCFEEFLD